MEAGRAIERKVITALFCDVVGSTELGERLDPEDIDRLLSTYHRLARRRVEANGGSVEKFIGDAVVGVFGAPNVHEDDPARAIRTALGIIADLEASGLDLQVRIGIQTGEAVVRVDDERTAEEGLATGDILNTAARLQNAASPGGIAVGEPTYRLTAREFEWEDLGEVPLKGKAQPVHVWRPIRTTRDTAPAPGAAEATPFLGRESELAQLLRSFDRARSGPKIELVTIVAEPGMGKSRLVRELGRRVLETPNTTWLKGRSLPYGEGVSFWALGEIIKSHAGILETDDDATIGSKLDAAIAETDPGVHAWLHERLAPLVGLHSDAAAAPQEEAFSAWTRFLISLAAHGPAVLVFEDLHWADPSLVSFLDHLADVADAVPILLVVTTRPQVSERHPEWLARAARSGLVQLVSLDDDAIRTLIEGTLVGASEALIATVLERAAGSPLYAEQLAALVRERGLSAADTTLDESMIPPTVQALLAARIDALPRELKPALLDASVIGRVFWSGAVATLEGSEPGAVAATLDGLAQRELTRQQVPSTMLGEAEFSFWHALLRDVAYSFLPRGARLAKHRAAAAWITERSAGTLGDLAEIVADHLQRALELATATGAEEEVPDIRSDLASTLIAAAGNVMPIEPARAVGQLRQALELLEPGDRRRAESFASLAKAHMARSQYAEAVRAFEAATAAFDSLGEPVAAAELAPAWSGALSNSGDEPRATAVIEAARPILEANPGRGLVDLHALLAFREDRGANWPAVIAEANTSLAVAKQLGLAPAPRALSTRGLARVGLGDRDGEDDVREAIELATAAGDTRSVIVALTNWASSLLEIDDASIALAKYDEALAVAARYGLSDANVRGLRLDALALAGHWDELLSEGSAMLADAIASGNATAAFMIRMELGGVEVGRGNAAVQVEGITEEAAAIGFRRYVPGALVASAALVRGDHRAAREAIVETLSFVPDGEAATGAVGLVETALELGDTALAREVLAKARPEAGTQARNELSRLATALVLEAEGDVEGALARFAETSDVFERRGWRDTHIVAVAGLGRCRIALGDIAGGLEALRTAREIAVFLKAPPMLAKIDAAIVAAGGSVDLVDVG